MVQGVKIEDGCILDHNPANGEVNARVPVSSAAEVDAAVSAARLAQPSWASLPLRQRAEAVKAAVRRLHVDKADLARLITAEMGKVGQEAEEEVELAADKVRFSTFRER